MNANSLLLGANCQRGLIRRTLIYRHPLVSQEKGVGGRNFFLSATLASHFLTFSHEHA